MTKAQDFRDNSAIAPAARRSFTLFSIGGRDIRFQLSTLLTAVALASLSIGWATDHVRQDRKLLALQQETESKLEMVAASDMYFDVDVDNLPVVKDQSSKEHKAFARFIADSLDEVDWKNW